MQLNVFTNPTHLGSVHRNLLTRLLGEFKECLSPDAAALLAREGRPRDCLAHDVFCRAWADQFKRAKDFAPPLFYVLVQIDTLARRENRPVLDEAIHHLPSGYDSVMNKAALHQAVHLWLITKNNPAVTWPISHRGGDGPSPDQVSEKKMADEPSPPPSPPLSAALAAPKPLGEGGPIDVQSSALDVGSSPSSAPTLVAPNPPGEIGLAAPKPPGEGGLVAPKPPGETGLVAPKPPGEGGPPSLDVQSSTLNVGSSCSLAAPKPPGETGLAAPKPPGEGGPSSFDVQSSTLDVQSSCSSSPNGHAALPKPPGEGGLVAPKPPGEGGLVAPKPPGEGGPIDVQSSTLDVGSSPSASPDPDIARLAKLPPLEYDRVRRAEAKRLGLRVRTLDDEVERVRILEDDAAANDVPLKQLEPWPEPILDAPALFDEVHDRFLLFLHLPPGAAVVLTMWPGHANAINAFTQSPRLNLTSRHAGCGKSTTLEILATFCPHVLLTNNMRPPVLYRVMHRGQLTVFLDELDTYLHLYPELRGLLNASNKPGSYVHRCEGNIVRFFKVFAATALAGLGQLSPTLRHRSIIIELEEAPPGVLKARFDPRHIETETILGRKIARWAKDNFNALAACDPVMPPKAHNRLADNWRPLFAVAQIIGGHWPERVLEAFNQLTAKPKAAADTGVALLADIRQVFTDSHADRLFSWTLVDSLCALPARPWSEAKAENGSVRPINEAWLARQLRRFGVRSRTLRLDGQKAKGYELADFTEPFAKFLDSAKAGIQ